MSISTGPVIPLSCIISINNHSIYCSRIYINDDWNQDQIPNWSYNKIEFSEDEIIEVVNKSWSNMAVTLQNTSQNQERISCAVSSCLTQENVCWPNFQKPNLAGNFVPQLRLSDGHFGQFRAIGPMKLLRPGLIYLLMIMYKNGIFLIISIIKHHTFQRYASQKIESWLTYFLAFL